MVNKILIWGVAATVVLILVLKFEKKPEYRIEVENESSSTKYDVRIGYGSKLLEFGNLSPNVGKAMSYLSTSLPRLLDIQWLDDDGINFRRELDLSKVPRDYDGYVFLVKLRDNGLIGFTFFETN